MSTYKYTGLTSDRRKVKGNIEAPSKTEALKLLERQGVFTTTLEQVAAATGQSGFSQPLPQTASPQAAVAEVADSEPENAVPPVMVALDALGNEDYPRALSLAQEALKDSKPCTAEHALANGIIGSAYKLTNRLLEAKPYLEESLVEFALQDSQPDLVPVFADNLAYIYDSIIHGAIGRGDFQEAQTLCPKLTDLISHYKAFESFNWIGHEGMLFLAQGMITGQYEGNWGESIPLMQRVVGAPYREHFADGARFVLGLAYENIGRYYFLIAYHVKESIPYFQEALRYYDQSDSQFRNVQELLAEAESQAALPSEFPALPSELKEKLDSLRSGNDETRLDVLEKIQTDLPREYFRAVQSAVMKVMGTGDNRVRVFGAMTLARLGDESYPIVSVLMGNLMPPPSKDQNRVKVFALYGLSYVKGRDDVVGKLIEVAENDQDATVRERAVFALAATGNEAARQFVNRLGCANDEAALFALKVASSDLDSLRDAILNGRKDIGRAPMSAFAHGWNNLRWGTTLDEFKRRFHQATFDGIKWATGEGPESLAGMAMITSYMFNAKDQFYLVGFDPGPGEQVNAGPLFETFGTPDGLTGTSWSCGTVVLKATDSGCTLLETAFDDAPKSYETWAGRIMGKDGGPSNDIAKQAETTVPKTPQVMTLPNDLVSRLTLALGKKSGLSVILGSRIELELVLIPAGTFMMGSPPEEEGRSDQERPLDVTISKPFYMGKFPVTQVQYEKIMGRNLSDTKGPNNPADRVSWTDASEFCRKLSTLTGRTVRLPTMAEWEYACRAGTATRFFTGNSASDLARAGWYKDNSNGTTHPVGQKAPNRWGIYDLHGNVYEWCLDVWGGADYQSSEPVSDPVGLEQVDAYSVRGGCWGSDVNDCRSAGGMECESGARNNSIGFRVVVDPWGRKYFSAETVSSEGDFAAKEQGNYGKARETVTMQSPLSPAEEETIAACAQERNGLIRKIIVNLLFLIPYIIVMFSSSGGGQPSKGAMWMLLPVLIWGFIGFRWVLNAFTSVTGLVVFANLKAWGWMFFFGSVICSMFGGLIIPILIVLQSIKLYRLRGNSKAIGRLAIALPIASIAAVIIIPFVMHLTSQNRQGMSGRADVGIPLETKTGESSGSRNAEAKRGIPLAPQSSTKTTRLGNRAHSGSREKVENRRPQIEPPVTPPRLAETTANEKATPVAESRSLTDPRASSGLIAFVVRNGKKREIYTMRPDGSCQSSLSSHLQDAFAPVWSPDGTQLLFRGGGSGDFYVAASDGSNIRKALDLALVASDFPGVQPFRLNADGRWLPDGKTIAVCAGSWPDASHIYLVELPDLKRSTMPITGAAWQPAWSPDGTKLAFKTFSQATQKTQPFQIWLLDVKTSNQEPVSRECDIQAGPLWLPDGKRIIFIEHGGWSNGRQNNKLCMKNVENGEYTETDFSWDVAQIVVSPDGQNVAFSPRVSPIYVFQLVGNGWQQKAVIDNGGYPTWSPDGTSLAFVSSKDRQIWLAHADGTGLVRIRPTPGLASINVTDISDQPDSFDSAKERPEWSPINRTHAIADPSRPKLPSNVPKLEKPFADGLHADFPRPRDGASIKQQVTLPTTSERRADSDTKSDTSVIPTDETREKRTWAFKSRPPITASLVSANLGVVVLRKEDGSTSRFTEKYLSDGDQNYVQAIRDALLIKSDKSEGK